MRAMSLPDQGSSDQTAGTRRAELLLAALVVAVVLALLRLHLPWAQGNPAPHGRDEPLHLRNALVIAETLADGTASLPSIAAGDLPERIRHTVYPPAAYLLAAPLKVALPEMDDYLTSVASLTLFALVMSLSVFYATRRLTGGGTVGGLFGLGAALTCVFAPIVFDQTHHFGPNLPATAMAALCLALFLATEDLSRPGYTALFALACGVGMLTYYTVFLFIAGPVLVSLAIPARREGRTPRGRYLAWLAAAAVLAALVALPYYLNSGITVKLEGYWRLFFGSIRTGAEESDLAPDAPFFRALVYYPAVLFNKQVGLLPGVVMAVGVLLAFGHRTRARWHLLAGLLAPLAFFTLFSSKWPERTMPAVPLLVILAFSGLAATRGRRAQGIALGLLLLLATAHAGTRATLAETGRLMRAREIAFSEMEQPFREMAAHPAAEGISLAEDGPPLVGAAHNQMLFEYLAERAGAPCHIVQAKTSAAFFERFDEMAMVILIAEDPDQTWFTREYLTRVATLRSDLGPADAAERLADRVVAGRGEFREIFAGRMRGAWFRFYLRRTEMEESAGPSPDAGP